jgi:ribosomal protein L11 methyltransferase
MPQSLATARRLPSETAVARLTTDAGTANRIADAIVEGFDSDAAVAGAFEETDGQWSLLVHFRDPPNEAAFRALVTLVAGPDAANALVFETVADAD